MVCQKELLPLSGAPDVDLITLHTNPVLTVVNFGKIISDNPADRGRQGLPSRRRRANLYFAAFFEIDGEVITTWSLCSTPLLSSTSVAWSPNWRHRVEAAGVNRTLRRNSDGGTG